MGKQYMIKLKGTNCYLRSTSGKSHFTTDIKKAKVFEEDFKKPDLIEKLNNGEYKVRNESHRVDYIRLTMDRPTWMEMYNEHLDQIQFISDSRKSSHQYAFSLADKLDTKAKSYQMSDEFPNFECQYYAEDFERESLS
jgi:hypothetical protein